MITVTYNSESYECTTALKGTDYIHLLDANGDMIVSFDGITDFSGFSISGGSWTTPTSPDGCYLVTMGDDGVLRKGGHKCSDIGALDTAVSPLINQWDEQWEVGNYNITTGEKSNSTVIIRSKTHQPVPHGATQLRFVCSGYSQWIQVFFYDSNKSFLSYVQPTVSGGSVLISVPNNAKYFNFNTNSGYGTTYNNDISINYPTSYTGYYPSVLRKDETHIGGLGTAIGMRGWNQLAPNSFACNYYTDSFNASTGIHTLALVNPSITWARMGCGIPNGHKFFAKITGDSDLISALQCTKEVDGALSAIAHNNGECMGTMDGSYNWFSFHFSDYWASHASAQIKAICIDLTALFGAGNEPSSVEDFRAMFHADYYPYFNGVLPVADGGTGATDAATARTNLGAAASSHTHSYAGSSSAGGAATSANKVNAAVTFNSGGSGVASGTTFDGSTARTVSYNTVGAAASSHDHGNITSAGKIGSVTLDNTLVRLVSGALQTLGGTAVSLLKMETGTYTGTGAIKTLTFGFQPKWVFISPVGRELSDTQVTYGYPSPVSFAYGQKWVRLDSGSSTGNIASLTWGSTTSVTIKCTDSTGKVTETQVLNDSGKVYNYMIIA